MAAESESANRSSTSTVGGYSEEFENEEGEQGEQGKTADTTEKKVPKKAETGVHVHQKHHEATLASGFLGTPA